MSFISILNTCVCSGKRILKNKITKIRIYFIQVVNVILTRSQAPKLCLKLICNRYNHKYNRIALLKVSTHYQQLLSTY